MVTNETVFWNKLSAGHIQEMLATVQFRIFCLPACHSEIYIS
jgi:hypothetical protein